VRRIVEALVPARLGPGFRWLLASSWISNVGDGVALAAGPLLVASQTDSAALVALGATLQWLPPLVFGLFAGALTDRLDRRLIVLTVNAVRCAVLLLLTASIVLGVVSVAVVLLALLLLATAESFADNASQTLLPLLVRRDDLAVGNARLQTGFITLNNMAGPVLGAGLFAAGAAWPFATEAVLVAAAALLISRIALPDRAGARTERSRIHHDIVEGVRWARGHAAVRTLVLTIFIFNITFGAAWSVLVLYASRQLGLGPVGFGAVALVQAVGGLAGAAAYGRITRRVSLADLMRIGLVLETLTHAALALTTSAWVAMVIFFVFGAHAFVWGTTSITVRQRAVPAGLQGRVTSVNLVGVYGGLVAGSAVGGALAQQFGVTAPFWFAFAGSAVFVVLIWRQLSHIALTDEPVRRTPG
jgi:MFS family permease